jgi:phosphoglycolate phosphatase
MQFQHIIFDLDGTLVDSLDDVAEAIVAAYARCGCALSLSRDEIRARLGHQIRAILRGLTPDLPEAALEAIRLAYRELYDCGSMAFTRVYPGVSESLDGLARAGKCLYLVTNKPERATRRVLAACGLAAFRRVLCPDTLAAGAAAMSKAALLQELVRREALPGELCVYIGDTSEDVQAAREAGVASLVVLHGYGHAGLLRSDPAASCFADMAELTRYLLGGSISAYA